MSPSDVRFDRARLNRLRHGALVVETAPAIFRLEGPGAGTCLQGILTNDVIKPGDQSLIYGAVLTPKGAIIVDYWVFREGDGFTLIGPRAGRAASMDLFRQRLPPRLAKVTDMTDQVKAAWVIGSQGFSTLARSAARPVPEAAGRLTVLDTPDGRRHALALGLAPERAPFAALAIGAPDAIGWFATTVAAAGAAVGDADDLEAARILAGWPALGAEIDERTLPQEVRYDELGGVSYTKGCYVGQETVARLHFRGHTNRELQGLLWRIPGPLTTRTVRAGERAVGTIRSTLALEDRTLGLAVLRREIGPGDDVMAGGRAATVVSLPFTPEDLDE